MAPKRPRPGEFELIDRYFRPLATGPGAFGLVDDAATLACGPGEELVVTVDAVAEGIHFFPDDPPAKIAQKALRVNLSDLAAKGADPVGYVLALALRPDWTEAWVAEFAAGLAADQAAFGAALIGGDTIGSTAGMLVSITAFGRIPVGGMVTRGGARPGDRIYVSGTLGDAALGLALRRKGLSAPTSEEAHLLNRFLLPQPRSALAPVLRRFASAAMDVSDGLAGDLAHICAASGVTAAVDVSAIPLSAPAGAWLERDASRIADILSGGDDYEILATVPAREEASFRDAAREAGVGVTEIGRIEAGEGPPRLLGAGGEEIRLTKAGHTHF